MKLLQAVHSAVYVLVLWTSSCSLAGETPLSKPRIDLHEDFVSSIREPHQTNVSFEALADILFDALPNNITVFPSEGYYYFQFFLNGENYRGNIRFDVRFLKNGKLPIIFYNLYSSGEEANEQYQIFENGANFTINPIDDLRYEVVYKGRTVVATLYDLSADKATFISLNEGEVYIGPLFDDSAVKFDLIYNRDANVFLYLLNERGQLFETFRSMAGIQNIVIGNRTGFAYFKDPFGRKVLVGVALKDVAQNSHYDGPFDQMPDTILDPAVFKELLESYYTALKGKILPGGWYVDDPSTRFVISPYLMYSSEGELFRAASCALATAAALQYQCLGTLDRN